MYTAHLSPIPLPPFKALGSRPTSQALPLPLKPLKLRHYLVYMAYLHKMYMIVYISQYPPMAACPPPKDSRESLKSP